MKLIKKINNNFALALDSQNEVIIVEGRGIGFKKMPCILNDLSQITRTYYNTKEQDVSLIQSVSDEVLEVSSDIFEYANHLISSKLNPNLTFILADHIQFCIERYHKKIDFKMPIYYDIEHLYPQESKIADYAMRLIYKKMKIQLPDSEKTGIALNIINSEINSQTDTCNEDEIIDVCTSVIEQMMHIKIHKDSFNYSRFVSHVQYLLRRAKEPSKSSSDNLSLYSSASESFPEIEDCVNQIEIVLNKKDFYLNEEEKLYLILHINRLCSREDCYR